ncbi:MAG: HD domain-containing protein [Candidatus Krumholzibacteriota bacterium]|nr:HD domain-containing protein [Candidatus Krumholzibacteriota bacterium]
MSKAKFDRVESGVPGLALFRIEGKLGFHENLKVEKLTAECMKRAFRTVVFDFSGLSSLGGGVARILRDFVAKYAENGGRVAFVVTSGVVLEFLLDGDTSVSVYRSVEDAIAASETDRREATAETRPAPEASVSPAQAAEAAAGAGEDAPVAETAARNGDVILMSYDGAVEEADAAPDPSTKAGEASPTADAPGEASDPRIITEIFGARADRPPAWIENPLSPFGAGADAASPDVSRSLKRRILELKTLFSISADFNAIRDKKKLLDIFLLTSIAQGGVEAAVFFERSGDVFLPVMSKGIDIDSIRHLRLTPEPDERGSSPRGICTVADFRGPAAEREALAAEGLEHVCPFNAQSGTAGFVVLGRRIRGRDMQEEDFEFIQILVNLAQGAFENALMFEREHSRTLGIVKSLISLIEENTMLKGTSEFVSRYVGIVAKNVGYPEEHFTDLVYGTVLRDMGMVKVSDLIVRSPRELSRDEWEIIKRHPEDGAAMLEGMKFNNHVVDIVRTHHERFNGEGYPQGLRGKEIPLGSRIISVVESYAAMIHERPNRPALTEREAIESLRENYGLRYDREIVAGFTRIMEREIAQSVCADSSVR